MIKKETIIIGIIFGISVPLLNLIGQLVQFTYLWPGYFVVLLYFIGGAKKLSDIKDVALGGIVGLFWSWWVSLLVGGLTPSIGFLTSFTLIVALSVFILVLLNDISPVFFNNYSFIYYITASLFPQQLLLEWSGAVVVVGFIFAVLILGSMHLFLPSSPADNEK